MHSFLISDTTTRSSFWSLILMDVKWSALNLWKKRPGQFEKRFIWLLLGTNADSTFFTERLKPCSVTYLGHKTFAIANKWCWTWLDWMKGELEDSHEIWSARGLYSWCNKATYTSCDQCRKNCLGNTITKQSAGLVTGQVRSTVKGGKWWTQLMTGGEVEVKCAALK